MSHKETVCPVCCLPTTNPDGMHRSCYLKDRRGFMDDETARRKRRSLKRFIDRNGTEEDRVDDGIRNCVKVECVETGEVFRTIKEAAEAMGVNKSAISLALKSCGRTCCGYHWKRVKA